MPDNIIPGVKIESLETVVNGRRIHYLKAGTGRPVLLVHGGASDSREWRPIMTRFGASDRDPKGYDVSDFAEFLQGFIALLKLDRPAAVAHSLGARACLDTVRLPGSNISKLILIDASGLGKMSPFGLVLFYFFKWTRTLLLHPQPFPVFLEKEGADWNDVGDEALKSISVPTLLIWKSADPYLSVKQGRRAERLIPGAKLAVIKGYGHAPHQQNDNSQFCRLMLDFLDVKGGGD
jgi:pimeloyl-ACP methyl ester carboxylesterase